MSSIEFPVDFLELKTEIAHLRNGEPFLRRSVPNTGDGWFSGWFYNSVNEAP